MTSLHGNSVLITGASSGIGAATAHAFAREKCNLLLAARRRDRIDQLARHLADKYAITAQAITLDVTKQKDVDAALGSLSTAWEQIDILVNNAGLSRGLTKLQEGDIGDWEEMIDTNIKGLLYVTRSILPGMVKRKKGHIINIGSIAGHQLYPAGNVYCATKFAVKALSEGLRLDLLGTGVRVTSVDPGMVQTEFSQVRFHGDGERAAAVYQGLQPLSADDVAEVILFCATRPPHVDVADIIVMPTDQASVNHAHRTT
jgi:3-hydroxy acid dehydrogenase / malonic semialdehyde reductase